MKRLNDNRMRLMFVGFVAAMAFGVSAKADFTFGEPTNLGPIVNSPSIEGAPSVTGDGLELYFECDRPSGFGSNDMWVTTRASRSDPWGEPVNLGPTVNTSYWDGASNISADGLSLFFASDRPGGSGEPDLYVTTRATRDDPWGEPVNLGPTVNSPYFEDGNYISADGLSLYFSSQRPDGYGYFDIWVTTRATSSEPWGEPENLGPTINTSVWDFGPYVSVNGLTLFFSSGKLGGVGGHDMYVAKRAKKTDAWKEPMNLGSIVNSPDDERCPNLSSDGCAIRFHSNRAGGYGGWDIWEAPIMPVVDLNHDEIVDSADICILVDHWGTDYSLCDIGPTPLGDGVVDVQDLIVLAEHLFEEVFPVELIAYWKLDEQEGDIAYNSVGDNHGILHGEPLWQPDSGQMAGALEFDGIDDYVSIESILNPSEGVFSVLAWVKGGAPGQVVLSQANGVNWLCMDSVEGFLMTELKGGRGAAALLTETAIADGTWHHIGLVWDGSYRHLYVDGTEVANDSIPLSGLESVEGGLYFGAGSTLTSGSFFSGLIDDVRIYKRVIKL